MYYQQDITGMLINWEIRVFKSHISSQAFHYVVLENLPHFLERFFRCDGSVVEYLMDY